jgi:hypothetical protein
VKAPKLAFTGTQVAIGTEEKALQRLRKELGDANIVATNVYTMDRASLKGATVIPVEGVASSDATLAVDQIAVAP